MRKAVGFERKQSTSLVWITTLYVSWRVVWMTISTCYQISIKRTPRKRGLNIGSIRLDPPVILPSRTVIACEELNGEIWNLKHTACLFVSKSMCLSIGKDVLALAISHYMPCSVNIYIYICIIYVYIYIYSIGHEKNQFYSIPCFTKTLVTLFAMMVLVAMAALETSWDIGRHG